MFFWDDLQWADFATLTLLKEIALSSDGLFLLIIGAYRDNEVDETHPLKFNDEKSFRNECCNQELNFIHWA